MSLVRFKDLSNAFFEYTTAAPFDIFYDRLAREFIPDFTKTFGVQIFKTVAYPKVNIIEHNDCLEIKAEIVGLSKNELQIKVQEDVLSISGLKQEEKEEKGKVLLRELKRSSFCRKFCIDRTKYNLDKVDAVYEDSILAITIPKITSTESSNDGETVEIR
jgi:HSP20 family protein